MVRVIAEDMNLKIVFRRLTDREYSPDPKKKVSYEVAKNGITGAVEFFTNTCKRGDWEKVILLADEEGLATDKLKEAFQVKEVRDKGCIVIVPENIEDWFAKALGIPKPKKRDIPSLAEKRENIALVEKQEFAQGFLRVMECKDCPKL